VIWPKWLTWTAGGLAAVATVLVARKVATASGLGFTPPPMPTCDDSIQALHHGGTRDLSGGRIRLIVLHSTEGGTARGAAGWFAADASEGSTHVVVDDEECYLTLPEDVVPWGAKGDAVNEDGLHVEMAGYAKWSRDEWLERRKRIENAAAVVLDWAKRYDVPLVFLDADALRAAGNDARGITSHREITKAYDISGGHQDPGPDFPIDVFMELVGGKAPEGFVA